MSQGCFFQPTHSVELEASGGRVLSPPPTTTTPPPRGSHCLLEKRQFSPSAFLMGRRSLIHAFRRNICSCARPSLATGTIPSLRWETSLYHSTRKWENTSEGTMKTMTGRMFSCSRGQNRWSRSPSESDQPQRLQ